MQFELVVAMDEENGIGKENALPWRIPGDMKHFKRLTSGPDNVVIMGRKTWDSIPSKFRPLPNRKNIVMSRSRTSFEGAEATSSLSGAINKSMENPGGRHFIIGGAQIYKEALPLCKTLHITRVAGSYDCDTFFPTGWEDQFELVAQFESDLFGVDRKHTFEVWQRLPKQ